MERKRLELEIDNIRLDILKSVVISTIFAILVLNAKNIDILLSITGFHFIYLFVVIFICSILKTIYYIDIITIKKNELEEI